MEQLGEIERVCNCPSLMFFLFMVFHTKVQRSSLNVRNFVYRVSLPLFDSEPKFDELVDSEGYDVFT